MASVGLATQRLASFKQWLCKLPNLAVAGSSQQIILLKCYLGRWMETFFAARVGRRAVNGLRHRPRSREFRVVQLTDIVSISSGEFRLPLTDLLNFQLVIVPSRENHACPQL